ncbi:hypothetical protein [Williamsia sp. 1135]|uniref:hypothetical protein n=1 Tax=Williamsia sp. 1135 TaxID=1889262 RepID=UPI001180E580|nr:hypothetical protein [Williamsia sp. 1135]
MAGRRESVCRRKNLFFDVLEVLHDLVARPRSRSFHSFSNCGYHHHDFSRGIGQQLYRWRVNDVLDRAGLDVRFAEDGDDKGRLTTTTDTTRTDLLHTMTTPSDASAGDQVRHAIALYRSRDADEHLKRSAVVTLAGVLEERRAFLKDHLFRKDEGARFRIAN